MGSSVMECGNSGVNFSVVISKEAPVIIKQKIHNLHEELLLYDVFHICNMLD